MEYIPPLLWITFSIAFCAGTLYLFRFFHVTKRDKKQYYLKSHIHTISDKKNLKPKKREWKLLLDVFIQSQQDMLTEDKTGEIIQDYLDHWGITKKLLRRVLHGRTFKKCQTAQYMAYLPKERYRQALIYSLEKSEDENTALYIAFALVRQKIVAAIPSLIDSMQGKSAEYRKRLTGLLLQFGASFYDYVPLLSSRQEEEIQRVMITFADHFPDDCFIKPLLSYLFAEQFSIRREAFHCLVYNFPNTIEVREYLTDEDEIIKNTAIEGLTIVPSKDNFKTLVLMLSEVDIKAQAEMALAKLISEDSSLFLELTKLLEKEHEGTVRDSLIKIISQRMEYFLPLINRDSSGISTPIIKEVLRGGQFSSIITFLNRNKDIHIENSLLKIIKKMTKEEALDLTDFQVYLNENLLKKLGIEKKKVQSKRVNEKKEHVKSAPLYLILITITLFFLSILAFSFYPGPQLQNLIPDFKQAINIFMIFFGFYCLVSNTIYISLLILSFINSRIQSRYQKIKPSEFLFSTNMLPSLSIIAPAYCEQETIIESVYSLLNLKYPNYEVIVVNDGSSDNTLSVLIDTFRLEREDRIVTEHLKTQPIRGIYTNPNLPDLIVVDKVNGGKADSLNAGINLSTKSYFAGIDSDSLLERDALLKLTSMFIDSKELVVASGGNIFPINGCKVEHGYLDTKHVPKRILPLFQNIEYLRSFMSGRLGWSMLQSLLIISGAFGVFHWKTVVGIHGYMTSSEFYDKDTVGEDMELVVRITRMLREKGSRFKILYSYLANCWTEVPESVSILKKQRDRWQRGLIDILLFHKTIFFNPKYGITGFTAFPYYFLFEVAGPWIEIAGTIILIAGIISGWLTPWILLFVLCSDILFGLFLSFSSLIIADWDGSPFSFSDKFRLITASIMENFGFRQFMSIFRIVGFVNTMKKVTGWGKMTRKGFK